MILFVLLFNLIVIISFFVGNRILENSNYYKLLNSTRYIVFGDSKPESAFNDDLIENTINLSNSGEAYFYTYLKARKFVSNNSQIEAVFIEFSNNSIEQIAESAIWDDVYLPIRLPTYLPHMNYDEIKLIWEKNRSGFLNNLPKSILRNIYRNYKHILFNEKGFIKENRFGGYLFLTRNKTDSILSEMSEKRELENSSVQLANSNLTYLSKLINYCHREKVKVYLIRTPLHSKVTNSHNEKLFQEILSKEYAEIEFLDFSKFPLSNSEFGDLSHLNFKGAEKFSHWFNNLLKNDKLEYSQKQFITE